MTPFYVEWKRLGNKLNSGETERERGREIKSVEAKGVFVWAINLAIGQIFMAARERIIRDLIELNIKIISKNLDGIIFLYWAL